MNALSKVANVGMGTAVGVAGAYALAPDLTTLTLHYAHLGDADLPFQVVDAWTRSINAFWSVVVTAVGSVIAVYLPASSSAAATPITPASPASPETSQPQ